MFLGINTQILFWSGFSVKTKLWIASYEWEHCWFLKFVFVAIKCNKIFRFFSFPCKLALVFYAQVVAIKTDQSMTLVRTVRINKLEGNLATHPENLTSWRCWDFSLLSVLSAFQYLASMEILKKWHQVEPQIN